MINEKELEEIRDYYLIKVKELIADVSSKSSNGLMQMAVVGEIVLIGLSLLKEMVGIQHVAQLVNLWLADNAKEGN